MSIRTLPGAMDTLVEVQKLTRTPNSTTGGLTESWATETSAWMQIEPAGGFKDIVADRPTSRATHHATGWSIAGMKSTEHRLKVDSDIYVIIAPPEYDPRSGQMRLALQRIEA